MIAAGLSNPPWRRLEAFRTPNFTRDAHGILGLSQPGPRALIRRGELPVRRDRGRSRGVPASPTPSALERRSPILTRTWRTHLTIGGLGACHGADRIQLFDVKFFRGMAAAVPALTRSMISVDQPARRDAPTTTRTTFMMGRRQGPSQTRVQDGPGAVGDAGEVITVPGRPRNIRAGN